MKFIAFLMAVIVLTQSFLPCNDMDEAMDAEVKTEIAKAAHHQAQPESDVCSPFCQCACCAGFSVNHFVATITHILPYESTTKAAHLSSSVLDVALPIWQPPQLV